MSMHRFSDVEKALAVTASATTTATIQYQGWAGGTVHVKAGSAAVLLTWWTAPYEDGTFLAAQDGKGNAITSTVAASKSVPIPAALFGARYLKAVGDDTATIDISFKS